MAEGTQEILITDLDVATLYEMMRLLSEAITRLDSRTMTMEQEQRELLTELRAVREAFTSGGLRGFRAALASRAGSNGHG